MQLMKCPKQVFFGLNKLSFCLFLPMYTWLLHPGNVEANVITTQECISFFFDGFCYKTRLLALVGILDHIEINLTFLDVAQIETSSKTFVITRFCTCSFGKLFLASIKLLENGGKDIFTIVGTTLRYFFYWENKFSH